MWNSLNDFWPDDIDTHIAGFVDPTEKEEYEKWIEEEQDRISAQDIVDYQIWESKRNAWRHDWKVRFPVEIDEVTEFIEQYLAKG